MSTTTPAKARFGAAAIPVNPYQVDTRRPVEPQLPPGATSASDFDPEDDARLVQADLGGVVVWAEQSRRGQLTNIAALLDQHECEIGYSAEQLRALIPTLKRAADLADAWLWAAR